MRHHALRCNMTKSHESLDFAPILITTLTAVQACHRRLCVDAALKQHSRMKPDWRCGIVA